jgi:hypothetical protein
MKSLDLFQKTGIALMGISLLLLPIQFIGILIFLHRSIGELAGWIPLGVFLLCMGMIFYGMLNALKYRWFLMIQLINCLLAWGNVYLAMQDGILL